MTKHLLYFRSNTQYPKIKVIFAILLFLIITFSYFFIVLNSPALNFSNNSKKNEQVSTFAQNKTLAIDSFSYYVNRTLALINNTLIHGNIMPYNNNIVELEPGAIIYNPFNNEIYGINDGTNSLYVINTTTDHVVSTIYVQSTPYGLAY
ncbi:MAG: hypothetical protein QXX11_05130, partial [Thermoplasmata archaeon]